jgi:DNA-binding transcriptional MerR regulator
MDKKIPNKLFFKIGEVCEITDTQPYVLRYWESEFPALAPAKNSSGQRIYRRRDIETVLRIKQLLYEEGFTIAGAKKRLEAEMAGRVETPIPAAEAAAAAGSAASAASSPEGTGTDRVAALRQVREQLREILTLLERNDRTRV